MELTGKCMEREKIEKMDSISDNIEQIINEAIKKDDEKIYLIDSNPYEDLISLGELIDRLTICNYKLYRLKDDVMKPEATKLFKEWAATQDVNLVVERSRLKSCIDHKVIAMFHNYKYDNIVASYNPETKKYGSKRDNQPPKRKPGLDDATILSYL